MHLKGILLQREPTLTKVSQWNIALFDCGKLIWKRSLNRVNMPLTCTCGTPNLRNCSKSIIYLQHNVSTENVVTWRSGILIEYLYITLQGSLQ